MMIVEMVLAISDKIRASPSGKGSIRKAKLVSNQFVVFCQYIIIVIFPADKRLLFLRNCLQNPFLHNNPG